MKRALTNTIAILMATLVFYGGAGVNMVSYCCNLCRSEGITAILDDKCCDIHHHNHSEQKTSACCKNTCDSHVEEIDNGTSHTSCSLHNEYASADYCNMERISFDWFVHNSSEQETDLSPITLDLLTCYLSEISHLDIITNGGKHTPTSHGPPTVLPRDYLSILTVLLI